MTVTLSQVKAELIALQAAVSKLIIDVNHLGTTTPTPPSPHPVPTPVPTPTVVTESPSNTSLVGPSGQIIDASLAVWTLVQGAGLEVRRNGIAAGFSANVTLLLYVNHVIFQTNGSGWWSWTNSAWTTASDPRVVPTIPPTIVTPAPTPVPTTPVTGGTGPSATSNFITVDFAKPTGRTIVRELFGVSTATMLDYNFALCDNTAFQAASRSLTVPLLRFNCNSGASGGNVWLNAFPNGPRGAPDYNVVAPLVRNLNKIVDLSTTKVIMGFGGVTGNDTNGWSVADFAFALTTMANYFRNTPGSDGKPINIKYWEIGNEISIDIQTYSKYFNAAADALHAIDPSYVVMGPAMPNDFGQISGLIAATNASRCGVMDGHVYLYCPGSDNVPSDLQVAQAQTAGTGTTPEEFANNINQSTNGTFAANIPFFCGEYNIGCGPSDTNGREQSVVGACFAASFVMKMATNANPTVWAGIWEYGTSGGWGTMDGSGAVIDPQAYFLSKACDVMPGTTVSASKANNVDVYATVNGSKFGVMLVNYSGQVASGSVALGHWPINSTGTGSVHRWEISHGHPGGVVTSVPVNNGMTANITIPAQSVVILYP